MRGKIGALALSALLFTACSTLYGKVPAPITRIPDDEFASIQISSAEPSPSATPLESPVALYKPHRAVVSVVVESKPTPKKISLKVRPHLSISAGRQLAKNYVRNHVSSAQYQCYIDLWNHESGWNYLDLNTSSGAYGIPQALPGNKMATFGADWRTNPITQVRWGMHYVNGRYGSGCAAWRFWQSHRWY